MGLKAVKPEKIEISKPKFMISGKSGAGKTTFALNFPAVYIIDTEGGATRPQYIEQMNKNGASYFGKEQGSQDFNTVIEEIKQLSTTKHDYKTLIIDSFSFLYNLAAAIAEETIGNDFGKDKKEANKPTRQLMRWIENLDMNVILICHSKEKWGRKGKEIISEGTTFDGFDKMEYMLDLWIEVLKVGKQRKFVVKKSRIDSFPEAEIYPLEYAIFAEMYGKEIIEKESKPVIIATPEQVQELNHLIEIIKVDTEDIQKWLKKAQVDKFEEMNSETIQKCIDFLKNKVGGIK